MPRAATGGEAAGHGACSTLSSGGRWLEIPLSYVLITKCIDSHRLHTSSSPCHADRVATPPLREGCHTERVATPAHTGFHVDSVATLTKLPRTAHCADEGQETACAQTYIPWSRDKRGPFARAAVWSGRGVSAGLGADVFNLAP